eukprot:Sspe_Gene.1669::Locus_557_Transcript_1_1_Confidence_1.000_Length_1238::g.1669::m.1669/K14846/RPF1; ribosome production factor 1
MPPKKRSRSASSAGRKSSKVKTTTGVIRKPVDSAPEDIAPPTENLSSEKTNKIARIRYHQKRKLEKRVRKQARREKRDRAIAELGPDAVPKQEPKTIENMRDAEQSFVHSSDEEVVGDEEDDEFAEYFKDGVTPKLLLTTQSRPSMRTVAFIQELLTLFPNSEYVPRKNHKLRVINQYAISRDYTDVLVVGDTGGGQKQRPYSMIISHLPHGPTTTFRVSSVKFHSELENPAARSEHYPELVLKNFDTRVGRRVRRQFEALFPQTRDFAGRGVATFHNQRDFIFVRCYRYIFDGMEKARLQEMGPRFTLRLKTVQAGLFCPRWGEYEWFRKKKEMDRSRRKFHV